MCVVVKGVEGAIQKGVRTSQERKNRRPSQPEAEVMLLPAIGTAVN
jgi:hypothetical protein